MYHKCFIISIAAAVLTLSGSSALAYSPLMTPYPDGYVRLAEYMVTPMSYDLGSSLCVFTDLDLTTGDDVVQSLIGPDEHNVVSVSLTGEYDCGMGVSPLQLNGVMEVIARDKAGSTKGTFDTEIVAMTLTGLVGSDPVEVRESPTASSQGSMYIADSGGGWYFIDSFFDVFTELSVDGGNTWIAQEPTSSQIYLWPEPGTITLIGLGSLALLRRR